MLVLLLYLPTARFPAASCSVSRALAHAQVSVRAIALLRLAHALLKPSLKRLDALVCLIDCSDG
jgi:hypothetical protein